MSEDNHDLKSPQFRGDDVLEACYDRERSLRNGDSGPAVKKIQQALIHIGFCSDDFEVDGDFGDITEAKVKEFQSEEGMTSDGVIGHDTIKGLDDELLLFELPFDIDPLMKFIEKWEGRKYTIYEDSRHIPTIGVGFNLKRSDAKEKMKSIDANYDKVLAGEASLSDDQIDELLKKDADSAQASARKMVANFDRLPDKVKFIVTDMVFNLGAAGFADFVKVIAALVNSDFVKAANEMISSRWYVQVGKRARHHVRVMRCQRSSET